MKYVSINAHTIRHNATHGTDDPPIRVARSANDTKPVYARELKILGPARLVYDPQKIIMRCGARLVLECTDVEITR